MHIVENKPVRMYFEDLMDVVFPDEKDLHENDDVDQSDKSFFETNNPEDAIFVAEFSDEISEAPSHSWQLETDYYVCKVPETVPVAPIFHGETDLFILFSISWDDNWSRYERTILAAARCQTHKSAKNLLLKKYALDNLNNAGSGEFREFIESLLNTNS